MTGVRPRTVAAWGVALAVLAAATGYAVRALSPEPTITVLANWTGADKRSFHEDVIQPFEKRYHIHVIYQGTTAESQVLSADIESGTPPDVAVLPGPGELAGYARQHQLLPLDGVVSATRFNSALMQGLSVDGGPAKHYWVPVKEDLKSIVWHRGDLPAGNLAATARVPSQWCLGMGADATSGWPGTDWIEDILLQQSGWSVYQRWATGKLPWTDPHVRRAWQTWGALVGAGDDTLTKPALVTSYKDAARGIDASPPTCSLEHQASFIRDDSDWKHADPRFVPSDTLIPGARTGLDDWEVSGDLAGMFLRSAAAEKLIAYLASEPVQKVWSKAESGFSADTRLGPDAYPDRVSRQIDGYLRSGKAVHCFDASDAMPPAMRDAFTRATLEYLADPAGLTARLELLQTVGSSPLVKGGWLPSVCDNHAG